MSKLQILLKLIILSATAVSLNTYAGFYRWVDENGKVHYSDKLNAADAKRAHDKLNKDGVPTKRLDRDKTKAERDAEKALDKKISDERKKKAAKEAKARAKDKILLDTFSSEDDLLYTRNNRLTAIESLINLTNLNNKRLKERLTVNQKAQERIAASNRDIPKNIKEDEASIIKNIEQNNNYINDQKDRYDKIEAEFSADLKRYRELKGITPAKFANKDKKNND